MRILQGPRPFKMRTSGSFLGARSAPIWCATGAPINVTAFKWPPNSAGPSNNANQYMLAIALESPANYLVNAEEGFYWNTFPLCEEY